MMEGAAELECTLDNCMQCSNLRKYKFFQEIIKLSKNCVISNGIKMNLNLKAMHAFRKK
jgi:hypothetical protein